MSRVLLLSPERIRPSMAGVGIRFTQMARVLASSGDHEVTLGIPNDPREAPRSPGVRVVAYSGENLTDLLRSSQAVVLHGHISDAVFDCGVERPTVVDLYDPFPIENLSYFTALGDEPFRRDRAVLLRQLRHGDIFLCSSDEQRLFYLGLLFSVGRLNPQLYLEDMELRGLIRVVPFGISQESPRGDEPVLRGVVPGIGADDPVLLFGGIYDWYDPLLLLRCLPVLLEEFPELRVIFCSNPNPESTPQGVYAETMETSREKGWLGRHVFFVPWVPFESRAGLYLESTVAAVLHRPRFETEISLRTRVLDHLWAGVPTVITEGGTMSRLMAEEEMGRVVPEGDEIALEEALASLLRAPEERERIRDNGKRWAAAHGWEKVLEPLSDFLAAPRRDPYKDLYPEDCQGALRRSPDDSGRRARWGVFFTG